MKHLIRQGYLLLVCIALTQMNIRAGQCLQEKSPFTVQSKKDNAGNISYKVIRAAGNTYGYDIYVAGKLYIHQITIPGMPGNEGFKSKEVAEKVAQLVKEKLTIGEVRPTVTIAELKKLKAI